MTERGGRDGQRPDRRRGGGRGRGGSKGHFRGRGGGNRRGGRGGGHANNNRSDYGTDSPMAMDVDDTPTHTPPPAQDDASYKPPLTEAVPLDTPRFADLAGQDLVHPLVIQTITDDLKFNHMMPVQAATLWELLPPNRSDCLVQAKTGTGKTVAFLLPALQTMLSRTRGAAVSRDSPTSLLVISPTRELAMQIAEEAKALLQRLPTYRVRVAIGGTNKDREERQILDGCDVLIATPGRLIDHMSNEEIVYALRGLDTLVLDEADRLLDMGFMPALREIVSKLPDRQQVPRQGMLFSATIAAHVNKVAGLVLAPGYKFISTIPEGEANTHERVPQHLVKVPSFSSVAAGMVGAVRQEAAAANNGNFKAIVFAPTAALAGLYGHVLSQIPGLPPVSTLHSRMTQSRRTNVTNAYRDARSAILTATDVIARGMDFPGVTIVFQVGIPSEKQSYIHRLGRTARADAEGKGVFLIAEDEAFFPRWTLKEISFVPQDADVSTEPEVARIMERMDEEEKGRIYQAWLGYYNNHMKGLRWDKEELVRQANVYAREALGTPETPTIQRSTVGKMGLRGTRGLNVVPDKPRAPRGGRGGRGGR
ncbi:ATP-dependent RNA helicase MSS116 [Cordyceps fumosorosea ARSEF 2679]|uniref:ATP-dependent RNA helicase n=1 Tax=Cordyceps fumosorosea (strain ARSEF 2679) TaxID=1081104 RepID=A0A162JRE5_CORFA|nr:ATP-dependent RNA helicase MSS116 [Cordyceps fumosorosea ARSEF 2679]OAA47958.1 ATP-dependent RNA helicase MSS116 [Cordyceps fumosorosea ARSEF 2679]